VAGEGFVIGVLIVGELDDKKEPGTVAIGVSIKGELDS
jgi:hypothetical protein